MRCRSQDNLLNSNVFCYDIVMTKRIIFSIIICNHLFLLLALYARPLSAEQSVNTDVPVAQIAESKLEQKWEPSEQDQLKVKLLSYQFLKAKNDGDYNAAFEVFTESTKSTIDFKQWKYNLVVFNATAGANVDTTFTRISWYENSPEESLSGVFATVDYSSVYTNVDIACGNLMWHRNDDGNFELIREQENFIDKSSQEKLSETEIAETKTKFGCKDPMSPE